MTTIVDKSRWALNTATLMNVPWDGVLRRLEGFGWSQIEQVLGQVEAQVEAGRSLETIARELGDAGLEVVGLCGATICPPAESFPVDQERANVTRALEVAAALGAPGIAVIVLGDPGDDLAGAYDAVAQKLAGYAPLADEHGVDLWLEFLAGPPINGTLGSAIDLVRAADHPRVKLLFDLVHYYASASHLEELGRLPAGKLGILHVDDAPKIPMEAMAGNHRAFPGEGRMDVRSLVDAVVSKTAYAGPWSIELYDERIWALDPDETMRRLDAAVAHVSGAAR